MLHVSMCDIVFNFCIGRGFLVRGSNLPFAADEISIGLIAGGCFLEANVPEQMLSRN